MFRVIKFPFVNHIYELVLLVIAMICVLWAHSILPAFSETHYAGVTQVNLVTQQSYFPIGVMGADVEWSTGRFRRIFPESNLNAFSIYPGDRLIAVNNVNIAHMTPDQLRNICTGIPGSLINVVVKREFNVVPIIRVNIPLIDAREVAQYDPYFQYRANQGN